MTPGQALLSLIEHYKNDSEMLARLKRIYLIGAIDTESSIDLCTYLLNESTLNAVEIAVNEHWINEEYERRYFETLFAYYTIRDNLKNIGIQDLEILHEQILPLFSEANVPEYARETINQVLSGTCNRPTFKHYNNFHFNNFIQRLNQNQIFVEFTEVEKLKLKWIVSLTYLIQVLGFGKTPMPLDIYESNSLFVDKGKRTLSRDEKRQRFTTRNQNFGLLKGYMPVLGYEDIAFSKSLFKNLKPCDYYPVNLDSKSTQQHFAKLVHPYSNGISGVLLLVLRTFAKINQTTNHTNSFMQSAHNFKNFIRVMTTCFLYFGGGHSLSEYAAVFEIPDIIEGMSFIQDFANINFETLYYTDNQDALDEALAKTLEYRQMLAQKRQLHSELLVSGHSIFKRHVTPKVTSPITVVQNAIEIY